MTKWISVGDAMPPEKQNNTGGYGSVYYQVASWNKKYKRYEVDVLYWAGDSFWDKHELHVPLENHIFKITHWAPLLDAPEKEYE